MSISTEGVLEGESSYYNCKQHHSQGEHVRSLAVIAVVRVIFGLVDLWGHVSPPSALAVAERRVLWGDMSGESKVSEFGGVAEWVVGDEDVVEFDVPMNYRVTV